MKQGIKAKDIRDFEKHTQKLEEVINRIREYKPMAYIYATPSQLNLMSETNNEEYVDQNLIVASGTIIPLECGDW